MLLDPKRSGCATPWGGREGHTRKFKVGQEAEGEGGVWQALILVSVGRNR